MCTSAQNCLAVHNHWCLLQPIAPAHTSPQETMVTALSSADVTAVWRAGPLACKALLENKLELHMTTTLSSVPHKRRKSDPYGNLMR